MKQPLMILAVVAGLLTLNVSKGMATTTCVFTTSGSTINLEGDCTTDETLFIPHGVTLNGNNHTIQVLDPPLGHFLGAVLRNAVDATHVHVKNLTIATDEGGAAQLADMCDIGVDRLRGILFDGASGSIKNSNVSSLNQGPSSSCQEGNAIEIRNVGTHPDTQNVTIDKNSISRYQKTGILAIGNVKVMARKNTVLGFGPVMHIVQNGIQFSNGATGQIKDNEVRDNHITVSDCAAAGILVFSASTKVKVQRNNLESNNVGVWLVNTTDARVQKNTANLSTFDGIALDDQNACESFGNPPAAGGAVMDSKVDRNDVADNGVGIGLYGAIANQVKSNKAEHNVLAGFLLGADSTANRVTNNDAQENEDRGVLVMANGNHIEKNDVENTVDIGMTIEGDGNMVERNDVTGSGGAFDIENIGNNTYNRNECDSSTGPPVDCP